jgi:hypothetical protein
MLKEAEGTIVVYFKMCWNLRGGIDETRAEKT